MRLILFDIDGTLLREGLAPKLAFARALRETYGTAGPLGSFKFAGMTDPECVVEIMRLAGLPEDAIQDRLDDCLARYVEHLAVEMRNHDGAKLFPGVRELLAQLSGRDDVLVGLLTGNISRGAQLKLRRFSLEPYFRFGAYGDDHHDRRELAKIALTKAESLLGRPVAGEDTTVVGDTPRDVEGAHAAGIRCVGITLGRFGRDDLADADEVVDEFPDLLRALP